METHMDTPQSTGFRARLVDGLVSVPFRSLGSILWRKLYILISSLRSCLGHIRTQLATGRGYVTFGPALEKYRQSSRRNRRTLARRKGIENLLATRPWLDSHDFEIFLAGFDAGEQWICDKTDKEPDLH